MQRRIQGPVGTGRVARNLFAIFIIAFITLALSDELPLLNEMSGVDGLLVGEQQRKEPYLGDLTQSTDEEATGFYSRGKLLSSRQFPMETKTVVKLRRPKKNQYTTYDLLAVLLLAAGDIHDMYPFGERVQIVDLAKKGGGNIGSHESHNNGLDADILYLRRSHKEEDPSLVNHRFEHMVLPNGLIHKDFDYERNWAFMKALVATGRVSRIFVAAEIKLALCQYADALGERQFFQEVLRRLRYWPFHRDHMHLRITCPRNSPRCRDQIDLEPGDGCDAMKYFVRT
jgi:penicillin-insensitive murein endopeptidase